MTLRDVIIDTNLLVLFVVGTASLEYVSTHKRLRAYTATDFDLLTNLLSAASRVIVTPHVLTETSNLLRYANEPARTRIMETFRLLLGGVDERLERSAKAAERSEFVALGLADAGLLEAAESNATLLTDDLDLYLAAHRAGSSV